LLTADILFGIYDSLVSQSEFPKSRFLAQPVISPVILIANSFLVPTTPTMATSSAPQPVTVVAPCAMEIGKQQVTPQYQLEVDHFGQRLRAALKVIARLNCGLAIASHSHPTHHPVD
jgi:hypothetical protein